MRPGRLATPVLAALLLAPSLPGRAPAQLSGSNLLEAQAGNWPKSFPDRGPSNRTDLYDQLNLEYGFASGNAGLRFETDRNSEDQFTYEGLTQRFVELTDSRYRVRVGNFYTILGRGLVQRSFELTGVVLDKRGIRARYAPSRDVDGVLLEGGAGPIGALFLSGSPSGGDNTLVDEKQFDNPRHRGQISGTQWVGTLPRGARLGAAYLRTTAGLGQQELGSGFVDLDPLRVLGVSRISLPLYFEYAQLDGSLGEWWKFRVQDRDAHALYTSANLLWGPVGLSAEWKDYSRFRLGVNDPPSLVREQSQTLLNRSTHVLDAAREEGFQLEGVYTPSQWASVTANFSRADGSFARRFEERYVEVRSAPRGAERWEATAFYDRGRDDLLSISDRRTYGVASTVRVIGPYSTTLDVQRQTAERQTGLAPDHFENIYLSWTAARAEIGSASVIWERTTDALDPSRVDPGNAFLDLISGVINARLSQQHSATLFVGKRRGGLACTAGTCYEVQPFEGAELRLTSRF